MIYELRSTRVRPGGVGELERRLGEVVGQRPAEAKLVGCWHTEIGPLLEVLELWAFADRESWARAAREAAGAGSVPLDGDLVLAVSSELLYPAPFSRELDGTPRRLGPIYELRIYEVRQGEMPQMLARWGEKLPQREELSPLAGAWYSDRGGWFHLWPYPDLATRGRVREEAVRRGVWPPPTTPLLLTQETRVMLPATFSPLQ